MEFSRRTFNALAGTAVLGLALGGSAVSGGSAFRGVLAGAVPARPWADRERHTIGFDRHSMLVDGRRLVVWSGEMHPFRLPSPSLWRDVLQKLRAFGYNTVSVAVAWNVHSPAPGRYDFGGVRDLDRFLTLAAETGLYVVLRPGPYIGADVDAGGFPGWLTATEGAARTADPAYLRHAEEWLGAVDEIAVKHLYTNGTGTILLYRLEDEPHPGGRADEYHTRLYEKVRRDGIDVPVFHRGGGVDVPAGEGSRLLTASDGSAGAAVLAPGFTGGSGDGRFDPWGGARSGGKGYARTRQARSTGEQRQERLDALADGVTAHNVTMGFGGTSWGWLPAPVVYTSYDYGAAIDEARNPSPHVVPLHQIGHLLRTVPELAGLRPAEPVPAPDRRVRVRHLAAPGTKAHVYVVRNDGDEDVTASLPAAGTTVDVPVPARDARLIATGIRLGRQRLRYATAQPLLSVEAGGQDITVFTGRRGDMAEVVVEYPQEPQTTRLDPEVAWVYDRGLLRVTAPLGVGGLTRVLNEEKGGGRSSLIMFADEATSARLWPYQTPAGNVLVYGPALLRSAVVDGATLRLEGDVREKTGLEVWAPRDVARVTWNGRAVRTRRAKSGALVAVKRLRAVPAVELPELGGWRRREENPEADPRFDDSRWRVADRRTSFSTTPVPDGQPVLFADDYGFHYGDVWYRGRFDDARRAGEVSLSYSAGTQGLLMAWLDGRPLGTHRLPVPDGKEAGRGTWTATATFTVPRELRTRGAHVLSVLVRPMQHDLDGAADDAHKAARGLTGVAFGPEGGGTASAPGIEWRLQGAAAPDPVRGPMNHGGLFGEREGWHLPGLERTDQWREWEETGLPAAEPRQGVTWYRTTFRLDVPSGIDASVGLELDDDPERAYRAQIFLNGWNMGQYINDVGPQHTFVLPNGVLRTQGENTLALAVLSDGTTLAGPGDVRLRLLGSAAGGVPVDPVDSPGHV